MSFESFMNKVSGAIEKSGAEIRDLSDKYSDYSDDRVKDRYMHGSFTQKLAAAQVLKDRGYGSSDDDDY